MLVTPAILLQGDAGEINLALCTHFAPEILQRAHLRCQVSPRQQLRFRADLIDAVIGDNRRILCADIIAVIGTAIRRFSIAPAWNIGVFCRPDSRACHRIGHDKVGVGGQNMAAVGQRRGVNQHVFAGFDQAGKVEHLGRRRVMAITRLPAGQNNRAHA